jgi:hypothetical protein
MAIRRTPFALLLACAASGAPASAQWTERLLVEETAGIRRTSFPATARLELPASRLGDATRLRLVDAGTDVPVQGTALSRWPDGSVRALDVDFNVSMGPHEARALELHYGDEIPAPAPVARGLSVTAESGEIRVGRLRLGGSAPTVRSVAYREELVVEGRNGIALLDDRGAWRRTDVAWEPARVVKRGPLTVLIAYRGRLALDGARAADVSVELELPNSKSWLNVSASVSDPDRRLRAVAIETPLRLGEHPWTWDFATPNGTYGAFRDEAASAVFSLETASGAWRVRTGAPGDERPYEEGTGVPARAGAWAHVVGAREAVAFAVETGSEAATLTARLDGAGQTAFELAPDQPATTLSLTLYQHYVSTPVPIGAATSPASILSPLRVTIR